MQLGVRQPSLTASRCRRGIVMPRAQQAAAQVGRSTSSIQPAETKQEPSVPLRSGSIVLSFDNTPDAETALKWTLATLHHEGDRVDLLHCICDPLSVRNRTVVGTTASGRELSVDAIDNSFMRGPAVHDHEKRLHAAAQLAVQSRCVPTLEEKGAEYKVHLPRMDGPRSAASIGAALVKMSQSVGGRLLVVASHGPGALAEFGSVARYAFMHSKLPLVLVPPNTPTSTETAGNEVVLVVTHLEELERHWQWVVDNVCRKGDKLHIWHAAGPGSTAGSSPNTPTVLAQQMKARGIGEVLYKELYADSSSDPQAMAAHIMEATNEAEAVKLVAVINYSSRGLIKEAMHGSLASQLSRGSRKPLVLLQPADD